MRTGYLTAIGLFSLSTLFWSGNIIAGRIAGGEIGPLTLSFFRWAIALLVILPFAWKSILRQRRQYLRFWWFVALLALLNVASYNTLIYWGLNYTTAINAAVLNSAFPVAVFMLTWVSGQEKGNRYQLGGMALAIAGVLVVAVRGNLSSFSTLSLNPGDLAILTALLCFALYSVILKRAPVKFNTVGLLTVQIGLGVGVLLPLYYYEYTHGARIVWNNNMWWLFGYIGLFPSVLAHLCWLKGVELGGANLSGIMYNLIPVFAIVLAIPLLGEKLAPYHVFGVALIFTGVYFAVFHSQRRLRTAGQT